MKQSVDYEIIREIVPLISFIHRNYDIIDIFFTTNNAKNGIRFSPFVDHCLDSPLLRTVRSARGMRHGSDMESKML